MPGKISRRRLLQSAAVITTTFAVPHVRGAFAAGKLSCGFWDHWVPSANEPMRKLCLEWAAQEKVDLTVEFITSVGDKLTLTAAAEAQARAGHDVLSFQLWYAAANAEHLIALDDVMAALV